MNPKGIILTGGPNSCYEADSPTYTKELFELGIPVLGLCYGAQLMSHVLGGEVKLADVREYGKTEVIIDKPESKVFAGVSTPTICWMSHFDYIAQVAPGFEISAHTADCPVAAAENAEKKLYAIQFHPEVLHTEEGTKMINNFVKNVCECAGDWKMDAFVEETIQSIREKVGDGKVLLALSGGVDSSVAAGLLSRAIGKQLTCVFVDHGLLRKNEGDEVEEVFGPNGPYDLNFIRVPNPFFTEYTTPFGVPPFDKIEVAHYKPAFEKGMEEQKKETPYGVPYKPSIWGAGWDIQSFGYQQYFLVQAYPDLFGPELLYSALNFVLGCHPGSNTASFASGVGANSATVAYGLNRADWSYIPGGVISGTAMIRPDFPELLTFPFLWQQTEYVMGGGSSHYMFLVLAARQLLENK